MCKCTSYFNAFIFCLIQLSQILSASVGTTPALCLLLTELEESYYFCCSIVENLEAFKCTRFNHVMYQYGGMANQR